MARKSQAEQYKTWMNRIELSKRCLEKVVEDGETNRKYYENYLPPEIKDSFEYAVGVNFVYIDMKQDIPNKYAKDPKFFFNPENPKSELQAELFEHVINIKWVELGMKTLTREAIQNAKLDGICAFKTYYNFKKDSIDDDWSGSVHNDDVRTEVVPLECLLRDADAKSWEKSWWIGHKNVQLIEDIGKRFNLSKEKREMITITCASRGSDEFSRDEQRDFQYGTFYEIEDRKNKKLYYFVEGIDAAVETKDFPDDDIVTMYDFLSYNKIPGRVDPKSDYFFFKSHIKEVAAFRSMRFNKGLKGQSKTIVRGSRLEEWQKDQIGSNVESGFVELNADQLVEPFISGQIDPNVFGAEQSARADIQLISKQAPRQNFGGDKTATEVKAIEAAQYEITSDARDQLDLVLESIANKWVILMQKNYDSNRFIRISGMPYADFAALKARFEDKDEMFKGVVQGTDKKPFLQINKNILQGKIRVTIQAGSTAPDNDQVRMQKLLGFVKAIGSLGLSQFLDPKETVDELVQAFGVEADNLTIQKDNPVEESRLLAAGAFFSPRMNDDHELHIALHERENKGSDEEQIHLMIHRIFQRQLDKINNVKAELQQSRAGMEAPVSGQSFSADQQSQVGLNNQAGQASPVGQAGQQPNLNGGGLPPQGA